MTDGAADVVLVLRPVADPFAGPGRPPRDVPYRLKVALKVLLRSFGLKCISISDVGPGEAVPCAVVGAGIPSVDSCKPCNPAVSG